MNAQLDYTTNAGYWSLDANPVQWRDGSRPYRGAPVNLRHERKTGTRGRVSFEVDATPVIREISEKIRAYGMDLIFSKSRQFFITGRNAERAPGETFISRELLSRAYNSGWIACNEASRLWQEWKDSRPVQPADETYNPEAECLTEAEGRARVRSVGVTDYEEIREVSGCRLEPEDDASLMAEIQAGRAEEERRAQAYQPRRNRRGFELAWPVKSPHGVGLETAQDIAQLMRDNPLPAITKDGEEIAPVRLYEVAAFLEEAVDELHTLRMAHKITPAQAQRMQFLNALTDSLEYEFTSGRYGIAAEGVHELQWTPEGPEPEDMD